MKIALVHDWLTGMRGGERVLERVARNFPDADLHTLVSRRLMMTERMLWYIGRGGSRTWDFKPGRGKEWQDGWARMFEYPRLSVDKGRSATISKSTPA